MEHGGSSQFLHGLVFIMVFKWLAFVFWMQEDED